jgi:hypothetical protein
MQHFLAAKMPQESVLQQLGLSGSFSELSPEKAASAFSWPWMCWWTMVETKHLNKVGQPTVSPGQKKAAMACLKEEILRFGDLH